VWELIEEGWGLDKEKRMKFNEVEKKFAKVPIFPIGKHNIIIT
jgi:hypothetical protein